MQPGCIYQAQALELRPVPKSAQAESASQTAPQHLRAAGLKVTSARTRVLAVLLEAERALTHAELESYLNAAGGVESGEHHGAMGMDRVTLYRVLEDLARHALARRVAGSDGVWRFGRGTAGRARPAQFECRQCGTLVLLEGAGPAPDLATLQLMGATPSGFRPEQIEVTVRGRCARCV